MQISFKGLDENIRIGRAAIRNVKETYPRGFVSNSKYDKYSINRNETMSKRLASRIMQARDIIDYQKKLGKDEYAAIQKALEKTGAANCGEQAVLVSKSLENSGIKNNIVSILVYRDEPNSMYCIDGHTFCVIGLADDAVISKPETWGKEAVVVDLWAGIVDKASRALKGYKDFLDYDEKKHKLVYSSVYL